MRDKQEKLHKDLFIAWFYSKKTRLKAWWHAMCLAYGAAQLTGGLAAALGGEQNQIHESPQLIQPGIHGGMEVKGQICVLGYSTFFVREKKKKERRRENRRRQNLKRGLARAGVDPDRGACLASFP